MLLVHPESRGLYFWTIVGSMWPPLKLPGHLDLWKRFYFCKKRLGLVPRTPNIAKKFYNVMKFSGLESLKWGRISHTYHTSLYPQIRSVSVVTSLKQVVLKTQRNSRGTVIIPELRMTCVGRLVGLAPVINQVEEDLKSLINAIVSKVLWERVIEGRGGFEITYQCYCMMYLKCYESG